MPDDSPIYVTYARSARAVGAAARAALACLVLAATLLLPGTTLAAVVSERPPLHIDRSVVAQSDAGWSELQESLLQTRVHAPPAFASTTDGLVLADPATTATDNCGISVHSGDFNGDGHMDLLTACSNYSGMVGAGRALVYLRNITNDGFDVPVSLTHPAPAANMNCRSKVWPADVNGDGRDDVLVGCQASDTGAADTGSMLVFTRNSTNTGFDPGVVIENPSPAANDSCGLRIAGGDFNGDGRDDLAMGCLNDDPGAVADAGSVAVFLRNPSNSGFTLDAVLTRTVPATADTCGYGLGVGDVNGDGRADVVMGCPSADTGASNAGIAVVFLRSAANTGFDAGVEIANPAPGADDRCASNVIVQDVTGDGRDDVLMGCYLDDTAAVDAGDVVVATRDAANTGFDPAITLVHPSAAVGDNCAWTVSVGDATGDGRPDVSMGCSADDAPAVNQGSMVVFPRNAANTGFDAGNVYTAPTGAANDLCGNSLALADVDGDGRAEGLLGCYGDDDLAADGGTVVVLDMAGGRRELVHPSGSPSDRHCGAAVATGDVNGDGTADVVSGCPQDDTGATDAGSVVVFARTGANTDFAIGLELDHPAAAASDECGTSVAIGDVNADGNADVVMGCHLDDTGGSATGSVVVFTRNGANTGFDAGVELDHPAAAAGDECGTSVAVADVNADGAADIVTGCRADDTGGANAGSAVVFTRNAANTGFDPGVELGHPAPAASDDCGASVAAGDLNGDGAADIALGCRLDDTGGASAGSVVVLTRNAGNTGFDAGVELGHSSPAAGDECGTSVAVGDVDRDGRGDVLIGCRLDDTGGADAGSAVVRTRNAGNTGFDVGVEVDHPAAAAGDGCGGSVAAGDIDGDGRVDIVLGCSGDDTIAADSGSSVIVTRNAANSGWDSGVSVTRSAPSINDQCGAAVATGDVNADGRADITIGCWLNDAGAADAGGAVTLVSTAGGSAATVGTVANAVVLTHAVPTASDECGTSITAGDVNGDGRFDVVMGCRLDDTGGSGAGSVLVRTRNAANSGFDAAVELGHPVPAASDECGTAVATGDVNGDGRADVVMGCPLDDTGGSAAGSVVVFTRNTANTGFDAGVELDHPTPTADDRCGTSVAIGDVNADGRADVLAGCVLDDTGGSAAGSVIVFTRDATNTGFDTGVEVGHSSPAADDECGSSLAAGDVNADGRADVVVGCHLDDTGGSAAGSVVVLTRNLANTGFDTGVELGHPSPAANDECGSSVAVGDVNADTRADVIIGCRLDDTGGASAGSAIVRTRNAGNAGFDAGIELDHPQAAAGDECGTAVAVADVDGDRRGDVVLGCPLDDTGGGSAGSAVVLLRDVSNSTFGAGTEIGHSTPGAGDQCGFSTVGADVDADGRADVIEGCRLDDAGAGDTGAAIALVDRSTTVVSRKLNLAFGTITAATFHLKRVSNGAAAPRLQASADGGASWESVSDGVAHSFVSAGTDVRLRVELPAAPTPRTTQLVHDISMDLTYTPFLAPSAPALVAPAAAGSTTDTTPDLVATFSDPNGADTGTIAFEACTVTMAAGQTCATAGGSVLAAGSSPAGIVNGANGTWTVSPALVPQVLHWHVRATDNLGLQSGWSASRQLTIAETITVAVDSPTVAMGSVSPNVDITGTSTVTVQTNDPQGYTLSATDTSDTDGADCACGFHVPDWTGTSAAPTAWSAGTSGASGWFGITVRDATGVSDDRLAKWGPANSSGWPANDLANNLYIGVQSGTSSVLHDVSTAVANDTVVVTYRLDPAVTTTAGAYTSTITYTAIGKP